MELSRRELLSQATVAAGTFTAATFAAGDLITRNSSAEQVSFEEITDRSRRAMRQGTEWLLKALNKDGGAGLDFGLTSDVACSSVVGIALLSQGHTPDQGDLSYHQKRLAQFLLLRVENMTGYGALQAEQSQIEGDLGPFATHFFAAIYLSQVIGEAPDLGRYMEALQRLEAYISNNQHRDGSWGTDAWAPMLATACGWIALRAANFAGVKVSGSSTKAGNYLISNMPRLGEKWGGDDWYHRFYGTAAGLRVLYSLQKEDEQHAKQALKDVLALVGGSDRTFGGAGGEEYLTFHFLTEMFMQKGDQDWLRWYPIVRDRLLKVQNRDGSWTGHHCITSRTFSTACALMVLSAPNRFLPISQV